MVVTIEEGEFGMRAWSICINGRHIVSVNERYEAEDIKRRLESVLSKRIQ